MYCQVVEDTEVDDDSVLDMTRIPTCFRARHHGRRSAANRARRPIIPVQE